MPKTPTRSKPEASSKPHTVKKTTAPRLTGVVKRRKSATPASAAPEKTPARPLRRTPAPVAPVAPEALPTPLLVTACVEALEEKKAEDLRVIDVRGRSAVTDFFIVATGNSEPHLRALRIAAQKALIDANATLVGTESQSASGWCVVDAFEVIVHLFLTGQRTNYDFERLWTRS